MFSFSYYIASNNLYINFTYPILSVVLLSKWLTLLLLGLLEM